MVKCYNDNTKVKNKTTMSVPTTVIENHFGGLVNAIGTEGRKQFKILGE